MQAEDSRLPRKSGCLKVPRQLSRRHDIDLKWLGPTVTAAGAFDSRSSDEGVLV